MGVCIIPVLDSEDLLLTLTCNKMNHYQHCRTLSLISTIQVLKELTCGYVLLDFIFNSMSHFLNEHCSAVNIHAVSSAAACGACILVTVLSF